MNHLIHRCFINERFQARFECKILDCIAYIVVCDHLEIVNKWLKKVNKNYHMIVCYDALTKPTTDMIISLL